MNPHNHEPTRQVSIHRLRGDERNPAADGLAVEEPMEIRIGKVSIVVTMRTPGHDHELAAGFLYTEGIISDADALLGLSHCKDLADADAEGNVVMAELAEDAVVALEQVSRRFHVTSSCGVCGKTSIDQVCRRVEPITSASVVPREVLARLPVRMRDAQRIFGLTGGLHAAALFTLDGRLRCVREDVGRHNAVDKLIGWAMLEGEIPLEDHVLLVSGRASFEIVQKASAARIPIVASVSAPSSLAVSLAVESSMTLVGFLRGEDMNVYAGAERIR